MKFQPKTQEELDSLSLDRPLLPDGIYEFSVIEADETKSEAGNDMIRLKIEVYGKEAQPYFMKDFLLEAMAFKLHHFCKATGLYQNYQKGQLEAYMCIGKNGHLKLGIQKGKAKPDGNGMYGDQNTVKDYIVGESTTQESAKNTNKAFEDQEDDPDVPF